MSRRSLRTERPTSARSDSSRSSITESRSRQERHLNIRDLRSGDEYRRRPTKPTVEKDTVASSEIDTNPPGTKTQDKADPARLKAALAYVEQVKVFSVENESPSTYEGFLNICLDFQKELITSDDVDSHVKKLLKDAPGLYEDFKQFLPVLNKADIRSGSRHDTSRRDTDQQEARSSRHTL